MPRRDICDTGDDALPDPNAPVEKEKEPETLEEALAAAAKKLRGVDTDHRKLTIQELQRALFDEDLNPFVTWLTANASTVFSVTACVEINQCVISRRGPNRPEIEKETTHDLV